MKNNNNFTLSIFVCLFLLLTLQDLCSNSLEFESELFRFKRDKKEEAKQLEQPCVEPKFRIGTVRGEEKEIFVLEGKCFDECHQQFTQPPGQNGSTFWQRLKGIFDRIQGGSNEEKKDKLKSACFLKCFCQ